MPGAATEPPPPPPGLACPRPLPRVHRASRGGRGHTARGSPRTVWSRASRRRLNGPWASTVSPFELLRLFALGRLNEIPDSLLPSLLVVIIVVECQLPRFSLSLFMCLFELSGGWAGAGGLLYPRLSTRFSIILPYFVHRIVSCA